MYQAEEQYKEVHLAADLNHTLQSSFYETEIYKILIWSSPILLTILTFMWYQILEGKKNVSLCLP